MPTIPVSANLASHRGQVNPWWYAITAFLTLIAGVSTMNILFNVLGSSLTGQFGWNRLQISLGLSIFTIFTGLSLVSLGFLIDRFGVRNVSTPMIVIFGLGIVSLSLMPDNLAVLYLLCAIAGTGAGAATAAVHSMVIIAWFKERRGLALGIINVGIGLCGAIMPFAVSGLLGSVGWRGVFLIVGLLCTILPALNYAFFVRMPEEWERERRMARARGKVAGAPLRAIAATRQFWIICFAIFLVSAGTYGILSQIVSITTDRGFERSVSLSVLSAVSLSSILSRVVVGYLLDRVFAPLLAAFIFILCGMGVAGLSFSASVPVLYLSAILIGLGLGAEGDIAAYTVSRYVSTQSYARVFGIVMFLYAQGGALGVFLLGYSFTKLGGYDVAIWAIVCMVGLAAVSLLFIGPYKYGVDGKPAMAEK